MSTATYAVPSAGPAQPNPFVETLRAKLAGRSVKATFALALERGREWLAQGLNRLHAAKLYTSLRGFGQQYGAWGVGLAATAGPGSVAIYSLTTHRGRRYALLATIGAYGIVTTPIRFVARQVAKLTGRLGTRGMALNAKVAMLTDKTEAFGMDKLQSALSWIADRHDTQWMKLVRNFAWFQVCTRMIQRFVPSGWMRLAAYGAMAVVPNTSSDSAVRGGKPAHQSMASAAIDLVPNVFTKPAPSVPAESAGMTDAEVAAAVLPPANNRQERREQERLVGAAGSGKPNGGGKPHQGRPANHQR